MRIKYILALVLIFLASCQQNEELDPEKVYDGISPYSSNFVEGSISGHNITYRVDNVIGQRFHAPETPGLSGVAWVDESGGKYCGSIGGTFCSGDFSSTSTRERLHTRLACSNSFGYVDVEREAMENGKLKALHGRLKLFAQKTRTIVFSEPEILNEDITCFDRSFYDERY